MSAAAAEDPDKAGVRAGSDLSRRMHAPLQIRAHARAGKVASEVANEPTANRRAVAMIMEHSLLETRVRAGVSCEAQRCAAALARRETWSGFPD